MDKLRKKVNFDICSKYSKARFIILNKKFKSEKFSKLNQFSISKHINFYVYIIIYFQDYMMIENSKV